MKQNELVRFWRSDSNTSRAKLLLLFLISADLVLMLLHVLRVANVLDDPLFSLSREFGYAEIFQYTKEIWILVWLFYVFKVTRETGYAVWGFLFLYLLFDDALQIHETLGRYMAQSVEFSLTLGVPPRVFAQALVSATVGALFLLAIIFRYVRGTAAFKQATRHLLLLLVALALFGVFGDMLNTEVLNRWKYYGTIMTFIEEGGEMIVMSVIAWYAYVLKNL